MKRKFLFLGLAMLASPRIFGQGEPVLRPELSLLKPLVGKTWTATDTHPSGQMTLHFSLRLDPIHAGKVLRLHTVCEELRVETDGYFYFDPDKKEITFLWLTSNGNITVGKVVEDQGKILLTGLAIFPDKKLEFRDIYEIGPNGAFTDRYFRLEDGKWQAGHSRTYKAK